MATKRLKFIKPIGLIFGLSALVYSVSILPLSSDSDSTGKYKSLLASAKSHLGVWAWGQNKSRLISPHDDVIKHPISIPFFDGMVLKALSFGVKHAAAIDHNGNLIQWNNLSVSEPRVTIKGIGLVDAVCSIDCVVALSSSGKIYRISQGVFDSVTLKYQSVIEEVITLPKRGWLDYEKITHLSASEDQIVALSSAHKAYSFPLKSNGIPKNSGQQPVKGELLEIPGLRSQSIKQIVCGLQHTTALTTDGKVYVFGSNSHGQLGISDNSIGQNFPQPQQVASNCMKVFAGGNTTFMIAGSSMEPCVLSAGAGQFGQLGNGGYFHAQGTFKPTKKLNLKEFDERMNVNKPIDIKDIFVGENHCACILDNSPGTEFGKEIFVWGINTALCRLDGKNSNSPIPEHSKALFPPFDGERLQLVPKDYVKVQGTGKKEAEQTISIGPNITSLYFQCK